MGQDQEGKQNAEGRMRNFDLQTEQFVVYQGAHPTASWPGTPVESDRKSQPLRFVFAAGAVTSDSHTMRRLCGVTIGPPWLGRQRSLIPKAFAPDGFSVELSLREVSSDMFKGCNE